MEAKHTPGPWRYEKRGTQIWGRSVGGCLLEEGNHLIADVRGWGHLQYLQNGAEVQDANARLIAAAPELLEGAETLFEKIKHGDVEHQAWLKLAIQEHFRSAIAKATGEAV